tara:strand:+ start:457 stop:582 length:126 start_codon:yes stop_codon:yes gene_type:complete
VIGVSMRIATTDILGLYPKIYIKGVIGEGIRNTLRMVLSWK